MNHDFCVGETVCYTTQFLKSCGGVGINDQLGEVIFASKLTVRVRWGDGTEQSVFAKNVERKKVVPDVPKVFEEYYQPELERERIIAGLVAAEYVMKGWRDGVPERAAEKAKKRK